MNSNLKFCVPETITKKKLLLVDDNVDTLTLLQYSLEDICGWRVVKAMSGYEGLVKASTEEVDAIILDGIMPEMDCLMFLSELRKNQKTKFTPVILLTGCMIISQEILSLNFDIAGVIIKPFDPLLICDKIAGFLSWKVEH
jgi:DNA-binding response OmpR family regulator